MRRRQAARRGPAIPQRSLSLDWLEGTWALDTMDRLADDDLAEYARGVDDRASATACGPHRPASAVAVSTQGQDVTARLAG